MADRDIKLIIELVDERLGAIAHELKALNKILEGYKAATTVEMQTLEEKMRAVEAMGRLAPPTQYLSGRWPLRDGNTYGIVPLQPKTPDQPGFPDADDPSGDLRSSNEP